MPARGVSNQKPVTRINPGPLSAVQIGDSMRLLLISPAFVLLAACGSGVSNPERDKTNAAGQLDQAAAAVAAGGADKDPLPSGGQS